MPGSVKVGGAWKTVSAASVKVGGAWKTVSAAYTKVGGTWKQWYSALAMVIERKSLPATYRVRGAVYKGGKIFIFGVTGSTTATGSTYYISGNGGNTWTSKAFPASIQQGRAATDGSRIIVMPLNGATNTYYYTDDDGDTWSSRSLPNGGSYSVNDLTYSNGRWMFVTSDTAGSGFFYSANGTSWTGYDLGLGGQNLAIDSVTGDLWANRSSAAASNIVYYRGVSNIETATNWDAKTTSFSSTVRIISVAHGNGIIIAAIAASTNFFSISSNGGTTWTTTSAARSFTTSSNYYLKLHFHNGYFYYQRNFSAVDARPYEVIRSANGVTWTRTTVNNTAAIANELGETMAWITDGTGLYGFGQVDTSSGGNSNEFIKITGV